MRAELLALLAALLCFCGLALLRALPCEHSHTIVAREVSR